MKLQFGIRALTVAVVVCAVLAFASKRYYESLPGPRIPRGTDPALAAAVIDAFEDPNVDYKAMYPGWAFVRHSSALNRIATFGDDAIPVLLANLHNNDQVFRLQVYETLSMLNAKSAIPSHLGALRHDDCVDDAFIVCKLAELTKHPDGYRFYRGWHDAETRREGAEAYRTWYDEYCQSQSRSQNDGLNLTFRTSEKP